MKSLLTLLLLFTTPIVFADIDVPEPPQNLQANEIINNDAATTLVNKINSH